MPNLNPSPTLCMTSPQNHDSKYHRCNGCARHSPCRSVSRCLFASQDLPQPDGPLVRLEGPRKEALTPLISFHALDASSTVRADHTKPVEICIVKAPLNLSPVEDSFR